MISLKALTAWFLIVTTIWVASEAWFGGRRPTPRQVLARVAPAGEFAGLVLAWSTLRAWQRQTAFHLVR